MSEAKTTHLSGDLARLSQWWRERADHRARNVARIDLESLGDTEGDTTDFTEQVDRAIDSGASIVCVYGQPSDLSARAAIITQTGVSAAALVEQTVGMSDLEWMRTVAEIRDARSEALTDERIEGLAAALRRCSQRRTPVLIDGAFVHAAASYAHRVDHDARNWWLSASSSTDQAVSEVQDALDLVPALHLQVDGTGDAAVRAVLALLAEFESSDQA